MNTDLVSILSTVKDPRTDRNKLYPLPEILLLCISAVLSCYVLRNSRDIVP
ncbi:MAG: DDE_Tnp_1-associated [Candidatus Kentron sp. G]|nr:MAG: DDE_Tnp_1-associated [Candidatus Kentron sp. G]VFN07647.1 MAG: DDE_Tnp_1-associated [Candidatus Kentron sp. G]